MDWGSRLTTHCEAVESVGLYSILPLTTAGAVTWIGTRPPAPTNLMLDGLVFRTCYRARVDKVVYALSGCAYPNHLQTDPCEILYLTEDLVGPPYDADNMYGWTKLMGEMTLRTYWGHENHAFIGASNTIAASASMHFQ